MCIEWLGIGRESHLNLYGTHLVVIPKMIKWNERIHVKCFQWLSVLVKLK